MKNSNKEELQQTAFNHSSDIRFDEFMKIYKKNVQENHEGKFINYCILC